MSTQLSQKFDSIFGGWMNTWAIPVLRVAIGIVFLWFGILKLTGVSPVADLVHSTYSFLPTHAFVIVLGIWEAVIGLGLIFKIKLRLTLGLMWLQMAGTFLALALNPSLFFFDHNPLLLTTEGEFVIKNIVLVAGSFAIGRHYLWANIDSSHEQKSA